MSDGAILRHPGSNRNDAAPTGNRQFLGGVYAGRDGGGPRRSCIACGQFKPQTGGGGKAPRWRCADCLAKRGAA